MKNKKNIYILSFVIPILIMTISFYFNGFFPFGSKSVMAIDFNQQFIDLYLYFRNKIFTGDFGNLFYSFSKSLGGNMIGVWSYYLNSPLNLLYALSPMSFINYTTVLIILIRYGLMGLTFTHFIVKRHKGLSYNKFLLLALSTAYALNGYNVSYQVVPIFYDAFWLLPLVLIGLEELLDGQSPLKYVITLAITVFIQYYMGFMICVFVVLYSFLYLISKNNGPTWRYTFKEIIFKITKLGAFSFLSMGLISFILIPNISNLLNSKASTNTLKFAFKLQINPLHIFSKLFLGAFDNKSWAAGPNLPNIFTGALVIIGVLIYFNSKKISKKSKITSFLILLIFLISIINEFTSKLWHLGQNPAGFFYRFSWILAFFLVYLAYLGLREFESLNFIHTTILSLLVVSTAYMVFKQEHSFLTLKQIVIGTCIFLVVVFSLWLIKGKHLWTVVALITLFEIGLNSYYSQNRLVYNNAYKFENAVDVIGEAVDKIHEIDPRDDFYRISKSFYRSKDDPMALDYNGLTHFSSNLEESTRDFFDILGNNSVDATTYYYGTPLTDALFAVKYYITNGDYKTTDKAVIDKTYFFPEDVNRTDLTKEENLILNTERFNVYKINDILPIAFGVREEVATSKFKKNEPVYNQEIIAQSIHPKEELYFKKNNIKSIVLNGVEEEKPGSRRFKLKGKNEGSVSYNFVLDTEDIYYVVIPRSLSNYKGEIKFLINDKPLKYRPKFTVNQLFQVADNQKGQEQKFTITFRNQDVINLSEFQIVSLNKNKINELIKERQKQGMTVNKWGSNYVDGEVNISDGSKLMLTSIMYDEGWSVKVDGKDVEPIKVWDSLMAFPINNGKHTISLRYISPGFYKGALISLVSFIILFILYYIERNKVKMFKNKGTKIS